MTSLFRAWDHSKLWEGTWKLPDISYFTETRLLFSAVSFDEYELNIFLVKILELVKLASESFCRRNAFVSWHNNFFYDRQLKQQWLS
jgi:hypothetical protein